jgi:hypothetical protein
VFKKARVNPSFLINKFKYYNGTKYYSNKNKTMKKQLLLALILTIICTSSINAQIIALHSASGVQIIKGTTALSTAYTASQSGDTLYLSGGTFIPPSTFDKQLVIFGAGHYIDSTIATGKTSFNGSLTLTENADMFYLEGVEITGNLTLTSNHSVNNVTIKRCKINGTASVLGNLSNPSINLSLIGNVLVQRINLENAQTAFLSNNIIVNTFQSSDGNLINNNIVLGYIYGSSMDYLFFGNNNTLNNNIFIWDGYNANVNGFGNIFNNNIYVEPTPNYGITPTAIGNYTGVGQSAIFVNQTGLTFDYTHNYHLQAPATYLGTDNAEVGIYGGTFPYKEGAVPLNPHIQLKNISPTTDTNGDLQIQIQVKAQED